MAKYHKESGRIRSQEKSFNFEMGGDPDPKYAIVCTHGWYHEKRVGSSRREQCVKCGRPKDQCELEVQAREAERQAGIRQAQQEDRSGIDAFGGTDAGGRAR